MSLNSQSTETTTDPVISCVAENSERNRNTKAYHCHEIIKTETNIVDTSTEYCKLCNDSSKKDSTVSNDFTTEDSRETNEFENVNPTVGLDSKLTQTDISVAPLDDATFSTFKVARRKSPRVSRKRQDANLKVTKIESDDDSMDTTFEVAERKHTNEFSERAVKKTKKKQLDGSTDSVVKEVKTELANEPTDSTIEMAERDSPDEDTDETYKVPKMVLPRTSRKRKDVKKRPSSLKTSSKRRTTVKLQVNEIKCKDCGMTFPMKVHLKRHRKSAHAEDLIVKCDKCAFGFPSETELYIHTIKKHGKGDGKFPCPDCPKVYGFAKTLRNHMHHMHLGLGIPCSVCGKVCSKYDIRSHEAIHRTTKDFKCDLCSAAFKTKAEVGIHRRRHTKPYSVYCEICGQGCFSGKELKEHIRIHTGEKPYACALCDYRCAHKPNLKIHMKVHNKQSASAPPNTGAHDTGALASNTGAGGPPNTSVTANTGAPLNTCVSVTPNTNVTGSPSSHRTATQNSGVTVPINTGIAGSLNTGIPANRDNLNAGIPQNTDNGTLQSSVLLNTGLTGPVNTGVPINLTYTTLERQQQMDVPENLRNINMAQNLNERQQGVGVSDYRFQYKPYLFYP